MKTKVLFIGTRPIIPMKDGRTVLINQYCSVLTNELDCDVSYACFGLIGEAEKKKQPGYFNHIYSLEEPSFIEKVKHVMWNSFIRAKWPIQASVMFSKRTKKTLDKIIYETKPDILICDMARTAEYIKNHEECIRILDMDDLLSKRYYRQAELKNADGNFLGQYREKIPHLIQNLMKIEKISSWILKREGDLMKKYEIGIGTYFDKIFFCSPQDMQEYNVQKVEKKAECIHVAIDEKLYFHEFAKHKENKTICYLGNIDIAANQESLNFLLEKIVPILKKYLPEIKIRVVGRCSENTLKKYEIYSDVYFTGQVEDIRPHVQECEVLVAPIQYGSGIKIKILESMALGLPVVTNILGVEGIDVKNGQEVFICETVDEYVKAILELLNNTTLQNKLVDNAKKYILYNHSWKNCVNEMKNLIAN